MSAAHLLYYGTGLLILVVMGGMIAGLLSLGYVFLWLFRRGDGFCGRSP